MSMFYIYWVPFHIFPPYPVAKKFLPGLPEMAKGMVNKKKASPVSRRGCRWILLYYVVRS